MATNKPKNRSVRDIMLGIVYNSPLERNINLVLRYSPIVKALKKIVKESRNSKLRILEIGSGSIGITRFYKGKVIGVDVEQEKYKNPRLVFLKASAARLPFKDNSFDIVLSVDTLEHLNRGDMIKMVREADRVARRHIFFTYPVGFTKYHEKIVKTWKKSHLTKSLEEHLHGGTATGHEIPEALKGRNYHIVKEYGIHPRLSYYLCYLEQNPVTKIISRTLLKIFIPLMGLYRGDSRVYYFVTK